LRNRKMPRNLMLVVEEEEEGEDEDDQLISFNE
jgi:hypothetical protein